MNNFFVILLFVLLISSELKGQNPQNNNNNKNDKNMDQFLEQLQLLSMQFGLQSFIQANLQDYYQIIVEEKATAKQQAKTDLDELLKFIFQECTQFSNQKITMEILLPEIKKSLPKEFSSQNFETALTYQSQNVSKLAGELTKLYMRDVQHKSQQEKKQHLEKGLDHVEAYYLEYQQLPQKEQEQVRDYIDQLESDKLEEQFAIVSQNIDLDDKMDMKSFMKFLYQFQNMMSQKGNDDNNFNFDDLNFDDFNFGGLDTLDGKDTLDRPNFPTNEQLDDRYRHGVSATLILLIIVLLFISLAGFYLCYRKYRLKKILKIGDLNKLQAISIDH